MLSRVADSLYWMSRYMERTDSMMRLLKTNYASSQENHDHVIWRPVLKIFTQLDEPAISEIERDSRAVLAYMVAERTNEKLGLQHGGTRTRKRPLRTGPYHKGAMANTQ